MSENTARLSTALADRYRIERRLGEGGMATVYLAEDLKHKRKVAVKVLRPELAAVLGGERFVQEITTTANLQHPHILPLFDSGTADGFLYYVMPFIDGETLRGKLDRESQLGIDEAVRITREIADALEYAHGQGVIHRDIKPENILIQNGRPMVADFGIALAVSAAAGGRMTETGLSLGTPHYMSPEQATAEKDLTNRADIYSLGSMLFEMLTGEPPHMGNSAQQIIMKIVTDDARPVTELRKSVPPNVAAAVAKSLERLAADRFESAAQFSEALGDTGFTVPGTAAHAAAATTASRSRLAPALALACVVLAVVAAWGWLRPRPAEEPLRYQVALSDQGIQPSQVFRDFALSPDGRTIVFGQEIAGERQLWIKTPDRASAEPLAGTEGGRSPAFSPDGEWIAFTANGRVRKVPKLGGSAITIADTVQTALPALAWLDNDSILFNDPNWGLRAVHQDGGLQRLISVDSTVPARSLGVVAISAGPNGQALVGYCNGGCARTTLFAFDLASGTYRELGEEMLRGWFLPENRVVILRADGGVFGALWDAGELAFRSPPIPILEGVRGLGVLADIALSANGTLLFVPGDPGDPNARNAEAVRVSRGGQGAPIDSSWRFQPEANGGVALSPDGNNLLVVVTSEDGAGADIWVKELDTGPFTRLTFGGFNSRPAWTPDGRSVLYVSDDRATNSAKLLRRRADGTGSADTILEITRQVWEVVPLRDTTRLIIRLGEPPSRDVFLADFTLGQGDSSLVPLLANGGYEEASIALSPGERWLAYASNESGRYEVYVRPFPNIDAGRWQVSRNGGNEPRWALDGRELFFRSEDRNLNAVPIAAGPTFAAGQPEPLFDASPFQRSEVHQMYDLSANGDFIFMERAYAGNTDSTAVATTAIIVQNWLVEVQERLGGR